MLVAFEDSEDSKLSTGYVGLMSVADFGYASSNVSCERTTNLNSTNNACMGNNYLFNDSTSQWTITLRSDLSNAVFRLLTGGDVHTYRANATYGVRSSLFLKPEVKIIDGKGTEQEPYRLSM